MEGAGGAFVGLIVSFLAVVSESERAAEIEEKLKRVREFIRQRPLDGLLFTQKKHVRWILGGAEDFGSVRGGDDHAKVLITPTDVVVIASNIDSPRLRREVLQTLGFRIETFKYFERKPEEGKRIAKHCPDEKRLSTDSPSPGLSTQLTAQDLIWLYFPLTKTETKKYRWLGRKCAEIVEGLASSLRPGMSEFDVQYLISREFSYWDISPTFNFSSVDDRALSYKRAFPKGAGLENFVNLNICVERWGLHVRMSRQIYFGEPSEDFLANYKVSGGVLAEMRAATRIGVPFRSILTANEKAYASAGQANEWQHDVQGGPILTTGLLCDLREHPDGAVTSGMTLAFQPSFGGAHHADTVLVGTKGAEVLTPCVNWPTQEFEIRGETYRVPTLMVID